MTLHKDIAQVDSGLDLLPEEELPPIFMKLSKFKGKKKPEWTFYSTENELPSLMNMYLH